MSVKHRITINLEPEEYLALQKIASGVDRSLAWLGRKAICEYIIQKGDKNKFAVNNYTENLKFKSRGTR